MRVRMFAGEDEIGSVVLEGDELRTEPQMGIEQRVMDSFLEPYTVATEKGPVTLDPEDDPTAFLFYLREFYRSGQGISAGGVEDDSVPKSRKEGLSFEVENSFCPTGPGGGQDNSCGSKGGASGAVEGGGGARAKFDKVYEEYNAGNAMSKEAYALGKTASPDDWAQSHVMRAKSYRKTDDAKHRATTEKNAANAADEKGYREAREKHRHAQDEYLRKINDLNDMIHKDGVRGKSNYDWPNYGEFMRGESEYGGFREKNYTGMDNDKLIKYRQKAAEIKEAGTKADSLVHAWKSPYYGEPAQVRDSGKSELGLTSNILPSKVERGSLTGHGVEPELKKFMAHAEIAIQMKESSLEKLVSAKSEEFKNGFEKGAVGSVGRGKKDYFNKRRDQEESILGIPQEADAKARPMYGYLEHPDRMLSHGYAVGDNYGAIQVKLKDSLKDRTSYTIGDSLDDRGTWGGYAAAVNDPLPIAIGKTRDHRNMGGLHTAEQSAGMNTETFKGVYHDGRVITPSYIEAQIHGGLKHSDIAEVRIPKDSDVAEKTIKKLEKAGVKVVRTVPRHQTLYVLNTPDEDWNSKPERR